MVILVNIWIEYFLLLRLLGWNLGVLELDYALLHPCQLLLLGQAFVVDTATYGNLGRYFEDYSLLSDLVVIIHWKISEWARWLLTHQLCTHALWFLMSSLFVTATLSYYVLECFKLLGLRFLLLLRLGKIFLSVTPGGFGLTLFLWLVKRGTWNLLSRIHLATMLSGYRALNDVSI